MVIQDSAGTWAERGSKGPIDSQTVYRDAIARHNMKDTDVLQAGHAHREQISARAADGDAFINRKLGTGEGYGLPLERGIEIDCVAVISVGERLAQRARAAVVCVDDGDGGRARGDCDCANQRHANCGKTRHDILIVSARLFARRRIGGTSSRTDTRSAAL